MIECALTGYAIKVKKYIKGEIINVFKSPSGIEGDRKPLLQGHWTATHMWAKNGRLHRDGDRSAHIDISPSGATLTTYVCRDGMTHGACGPKFDSNLDY